MQHATVGQEHLFLLVSLILSHEIGLLCFDQNIFGKIQNIHTSRKFILLFILIIYYY